jgi:hypothetical protein
MKIPKLGEQAMPVPYSSSRAHEMCSGLVPPAHPLAFRCLFSSSPGDGDRLHEVPDTILNVRGLIFLIFAAQKINFINF